MKKIFASQVQVGMRLPCDIFNEKGVLLWVAGSVVKSEAQAEKLASDGYRSEIQEWTPASKPKRSSVNEELDEASGRKKYIYNTVLDAIMEIHLPLVYIFDVFKNDSFRKEKKDLTAQISSVVDVIIDIVEEHEEEALGTLNMFNQSKYSTLNAIYNSIVTTLICRSVKVKPKYQRVLASAALTANGSIIKLTDALCLQSTPMTPAQKTEMDLHPDNSLMLLTRSGVREEIWLESVYMHHERIDGSGYPRGLKGDEIVVGGKILAIADTYVSLILPKKSMQQHNDPPTALKLLLKKHGKKLDRKIMSMMVKKFGFIPPGTFVSLKDGGIGVVLKSGNEKDKDPIITKVGDSITNFNASFEVSGKLPFNEVIHPPNALPKKLFKIWAVNAKRMH